MAQQMKITGGMVAFEDGLKKPEEYTPPKKARVELRFDVEDGQDPQIVLNYAHASAVAKVHEMLHGVAPKAAAAAPAPSQPASSPAQAEAVAKPKTGPKVGANKNSRTKADLEAEMLAAAAKPAPAPVVEDDSVDNIDVVEDDDMSDILGEAPPAPITDKELSDACVAKADKMKSVAGWEPKKIRGLIEKYTGAPGKHNREIPAAKRPEFLKELDALK